MATKRERITFRGILRGLVPYLLILLATSAFTWASRMSHRHRNQDLKAKESHLQSEIEALEKKVRLLQRRLDGLQNDPYVVESQVREQFGYLRPGERLLRR
ncbi:MAG: septum formation initiator family protein [Planctomycetota bacterium]|nr:septum formation initiator family protein [Planctomycetota bacterium]